MRGGAVHGGRCRGLTEFRGARPAPLGGGPGRLLGQRGLRSCLSCFLREGKEWDEHGCQSLVVAGGATASCSPDPPFPRRLPSVLPSTQTAQRPVPRASLVKPQTCAGPCFLFPSRLCERALCRVALVLPDVLTSASVARASSCSCRPGEAPEDGPGSPPFLGPPSAGALHRADV